MYTVFRPLLKASIVIVAAHFLLSALAHQVTVFHTVGKVLATAGQHPVEEDRDEHVETIRREIDELGEESRTWLDNLNQLLNGNG